MAERSPPEPSSPIELVSPQGARLWTAVWLTVGLACLSVALVLAMGELFLSLKRPLLEAIFASSRS